MIILCNDLGNLKFGISGDVYGYYKDGVLVGFKSQADIDAAYQSGYADGQAAGVTIHTGTRTITTNGTTDLGAEHTYRYIDTNVPGAASIKFTSVMALGSNMTIQDAEASKIKSIFVRLATTNTGAYLNIYQYGNSINVPEGQSTTYIPNSTAGGITFAVYNGPVYPTITMYF